MFVELWNADIMIWMGFFRINRNRHCNESMVRFYDATENIIAALVIEAAIFPTVKFLSMAWKSINGRDLFCFMQSPAKQRRDNICKFYRKIEFIARHEFYWYRLTTSYDAIFDDGIYLFDPATQDFYFSLYCNISDFNTQLRILIAFTLRQGRSLGGYSMIVWKLSYRIFIFACFVNMLTL